MNAKEQRKIARVAYGILAAVIICSAMALFHGGCGRDSTTSSAGADSASAAQQAERITELNDLARAENQSARAAVERADERAAEATDINQRAKLILDELIREAETRPVQRKKN